MATITTEKQLPGSLWPKAAAEEMPRPYRMTVDVYEKIVAAGIFGDTSPVFLWKGLLVLPMTKGPDHENALAEINAALVRITPEGWHVRPGSPVRLPGDSEPEPDVLLVRGTTRDYKNRHPSPRDLALAVEVSDSSLRYDSVEKLAAYAEAEIPVYWVVNIPRARIDVYQSPSGPAESPTYADHRSYRPEENVPIVLDGREVGRVPVADVMP